MKITYKLADPADIDQLLTMMAEMQLDDPWSIVFEEAYARRAMLQLLGDPSLGRVWMMACDAEVVGYVVMAFDYSLEYGGRGAWVDEFYVRKAYRGQGIGKQALEFFLEQANQLGVTCVHLEVNHGNPAIELYRRLGFEDHERYLMTKWIAKP